MICTQCSDEIKPVVAVDIDGTLADYHGHFLQFASGYFDKGIDTPRGNRPLHEHIGVTLEQYRACKLAFRQGSQKRSMPVFPFAADLCRGLRNNDVELWITTTRPYMRLDNIDPDTQEWMRRNLITYDHLFYDEDKYGRLLERVDRDRVVCVFDDDPLQIQRALELGLKAVWRRTLYNSLATHPRQGWLALQAGMLPEAYVIISDLVEKWRAQ